MTDPQSGPPGALLLDVPSRKGGAQHCGTARQAQDGKALPLASTQLSTPQVRGQPARVLTCAEAELRALQAEPLANPSPR